jgi:hypothetical protein
MQEGTLDGPKLGALQTFEKHYCRRQVREISTRIQ